MVIYSICILRQKRSRLFEVIFFLLINFLQIVVPPLPSKALKRQLPFRSDDGIYEESFIEERRAGLEGFVNK